jgi:hypothetical protein
MEAFQRLVECRADKEEESRTVIHTAIGAIKAQASIVASSDIGIVACVFLAQRA